MDYIVLANIEAFVSITLLYNGAHGNKPITDRNSNT